MAITRLRSRLRVEAGPHETGLSISPLRGADVEAARGMSTEGAGPFLLPMGAMSALVSRPLSRRNLVRGPLIVAGGSMLAAMTLPDRRLRPPEERPIPQVRATMR